MTTDNTTPNVYQSIQPAQGERPAESQPIRENWQTLAKLLDDSTMVDGHRHDMRTLPVLEGWRAGRNLLGNGSFEYDNGAGVNLFHEWVATGTGVTLAATVVAGEFTHRAQAAELVNLVANPAALQQTVISQGAQPLTDLLGNLQGKVLVFTAKVRTDTAARVSLALEDFDGAATETENSADHTGGDTFEILTVAKLIQGDATDIRLRLEILSGSSITAFIDEARVYVIGEDSNAADPNVVPPSLEYNEWDHIPEVTDAALGGHPVNVDAFTNLLRTRTIILSPSAAELVDGSTPVSSTSGVGWPRFLTFDDTTEEFARFSFTLPEQYDSAMVLKAKFRTAATSGNFGITVQVMATSDGDATGADSFAADNSAAIVVPGTGGFQETLEVALTNDDGAAAGDKIVLLFSRDTPTGDTVTGDIDVGDITLEFQATGG